MKKRRRTNYLAKCKAFSPAKTEGFCEFVRTTLLHPVAFLIENSIFRKVLNEERKGQIRGNLPARSGDARNRIRDSVGVWVTAVSVKEERRCPRMDGIARVLQ